MDSILIFDYIEELVDSGMTDIGIDLKAVTVNTFQRITGLNNTALSEKYMENAWEAVRDIRNYLREKVSLRVGVPYNQDLITFEKIEKIGKSAIPPGITCSVEVAGCTGYKTRFL